MFSKAASNCKLPVSSDAKPLNLASIATASSPFHVGHPDNVREAVKARYALRSFGGSVPAAVMALSGIGLFALTFGYHIGKPVYDAYTQAEKEDGGDD